MHLIPILLVLSQVGPPTSAAGAYGVVRTGERGRPIVGAQVRVATGAQATVTDTLGAYRLVLAPGRHSLRFEAVGRVTVELVAMIPDSGAVRIDVDLTARVYELAPVVIQNRRIAAASWSDIGDLYRSSDWARLAVPGGNDLAPMLAELPGAAARGAGVGTLHFQGGDADQYVVRLDGFPVLAASHFSPTSSAINPDLVRDIHVRSGAPSASEGDWLSGVIDLGSTLRTATGENWLGSANTTDVRQLVRGKLATDGRYLFSGRRSFRNVLGDPAAAESANSYEDWLGTASARVGSGVAQFLVYRNQNQFGFPSRVGESSDVDGDFGSSSSTSPFNGLEWWATTAGASWTGALRRATIDFRVWQASTGSTLDWLSEAMPLHLENRFTQGAARFDARLPTRRGGIDFGTEWVREGSGYSASPATTTAPTVRTSNVTHRIASYLESGWTAGSWLRGRAGVRANALRSGRLTFDPRFGLELRPGSVLGISVTAGRVHQFAQSMRNQESFLGSLLAFEIPAAVGTAGIPVASADNLSIRAEAALGGGLTISTSGYVRRFQGLLLVAPSTGSLFDLAATTSGAGRSSGAEVRAALTRSRFAIDGSFAVGSSTRRLGGVTYRPGFQRSRSLAILATGEPLRGTTLGLALHASNGQRTTLIGPIEWQPYNPLTGAGELLGTPDNLDALPNGRLLPAALRLDLGMRHAWHAFGSASGRTVTTSVTLINVLGRANSIALARLPGTEAVHPLSAGRRSLRFEVAWGF